MIAFYRLYSLLQEENVTLRELSILQFLDQGVEHDTQREKLEVSQNVFKQYYYNLKRSGRIKRLGVRSYELTKLGKETLQKVADGCG